MAKRIRAVPIGATARNRGESGASFETKVGELIDPDPVTGCWIFNGDPSDYGRIRDEQGRDRPAHRWVYELLTDSVLDDDLHLHHECEVRGCVNPEHLTPMTPGDHSAHHAALRRRPA